ncbi:MAG: ribonuclease HI family protein [Nanoarchaeota archaeon]
MLSKIFVHADGGSRGNPGPAAIGVLILDEEKNELESYNERIGNATNNVAEYKALLKALQLAVKHTRKEVHVFMDSELVINQMNGIYKVKSPELFELFQQVKDYEGEFTKVVYNHVPRENKFQTKADWLVNEALQ